MKVLVIGSGGREHALVERLARSDHVESVYCAPGNGGTRGLADNLDIPADATADLVRFAKGEGIGLTVVGPEGPLCAGIVDQFQAADLAVFGPTAAAARIEGDKAYAKRIMRSALVPTAESRTFDNFEHAKTYVATRDSAQVVKAAGLAEGKGVIVCDDPSDAILALEHIMLARHFGDAGSTVIVEEKLQGPEVSILAAVDGHTIYVLEAAQDHKPVGEGDTGPNTGGMGAYCPAPLATDAIMEQVNRDILVPIVDALDRDGAPYRGILYAGLMLTAAGPKVLEFNCRFGDPEAQAILPRLQSDLFELLDATTHGRLDQIEVCWDPRPAVCVVMASEGYPGPYKKGKDISGIERAEALGDVIVYHAGTECSGEHLVTTGGRVLGVTALGDDLAAAQRRAYQAVDTIAFEGAFCRRDIASRALR